MKPLAAVFAIAAIVTAFASPHALAQEAPTPPPDPIGEQVLPPELIMRNQKAIQLTEAQKGAVIAEVKRAQARIVDVQWEMQRAMEPLVDLLAKEKVDEAQVLAQLDKVLASEREFKRAQIALAVRLKNILTAEQQRMLRELRSSTPRAPEPPPRTAPPR
jgi:Spy/CpxP family protein refolding chaperone